MSPMPEFQNENEEDSLDQSIVDAVIEDIDLLNERKVSVCLPDRSNIIDDTKLSSDIAIGDNINIRKISIIS